MLCLRVGGMGQIYLTMSVYNDDGSTRVGESVVQLE